MWLDYDDKYAVSDEGLVMHKKSGRIVKGSSRTGYWRIHTSFGFMDIHLMVAKRFLPKLDIPGLQVDHIDQNRANNNASNLRWCDKSTQMINRTYPAGKSGHHHIKFQPSGGNPCVRIMRNGRTYSETFETLADAIVARDKILAEYNMPV